MLRFLRVLAISAILAMVATGVPQRADPTTGTRQRRTVRTLIAAGVLVGLVAAAVVLPTGQPASAQTAAGRKVCSTKRVHGKLRRVCTAVKLKAPPTLATGMKVDIGGYKLYIKCTGQGSPTVVFEAGYADDSRAWHAVAPQVTPTTRTCVYDRAGTGNSDFRPGRIGSGTVIVHELHALLNAAHIPGPYVLVGHAIGGLFVRLYAYTYPDEVAGLVLVDPSHEGMCLAMASIVPTLCFQPLVGNDGPIQDTFDQVRAADHDTIRGSLGSLPLIVLTAATHGASAKLEKQIEPVLLRLHSELATASSNSLHVLAHKSGHDIELDRPGVVVEAVSEVVAAVRTPPHLLPACGHAFEAVGGTCVP